MKFVFSSALVVLGLSALQASAAPSTEPKLPTVGCYVDYVQTPCPPGKVCIQPVQTVNACPWKCETPAPAGCTPRCKPCKSEVCPAVCNCEVICPVAKSN